MTKVHEIQIKQSECREAISVLLNTATGERGENYDTELREKTAEAARLEVELRAALAAEEDSEREAREAVAAAGVDPETRERLELRQRASMGGFLLAALQGRLPGGADAEYAAACGVTDGIPIDLFERDRPAETRQQSRLPETRVDAVTPAPATGQGATLAPVQPFVFAESIASRLGIMMPQVGSGSYSEATISTALSAAAKTKGDAQESTAAALTTVTASPRRISGRLSLTMEDIAQVGVGNFEAALRENARAVLADAYDNQCINGDGAAPNVDGLINQLTDPANPTAVADFGAFLKAFSDAVDGLWASMIKEVAIVASVDAYRLSARSFRAASSDLSFSDYAAVATGGWWTNKRMPATSNTIARGIVHRKGRMGLRTASHPVWANVAIDDIYSDSESGTRHFSLHVLVGSKVLIVQPDAYGLVEFKVA